ncbi:unnamed protein product [Arctogadus glacialis]
MGQQLHCQLSQARQQLEQGVLDGRLQERVSVEQARAEDLRGELERWRARYSALDKARNKEVEDIRLMMESQRRSMLDRELTELNFKFRAERGELEAQVRSLREALEQRDRASSDHSSKVARLHLQLDEAKQEQHSVLELRQTVTHISEERIKVSQVAHCQNDELLSARTRITCLEEAIEAHRHDSQRREEYSLLLAERTRLLEERDRRICALQAQLSSINLRLSSFEGLTKESDQFRREKDQLGRVQTHKNETLRLNRLVKSQLDELVHSKQLQESQKAELRNSSAKSQALSYESRITDLTVETERLGQELLSRSQMSTRHETRAN